VLYRCADLGCSHGTWSSLAALGPPPTGSDEILSLDVRIAAGDRPFVSVGAGGSLQLFGCSTSDCTEAVRVTLDETSPAWSAQHALAFDGAGLPFVVYGVRSDLKVARCLRPGCVAAAAPTGSAEQTGSAEPSRAASASPLASQPSGVVRTLVAPGPGKYDPHVAIGADGLPVAVFAGSGTIYVVHCGDARCQNGNTETAIAAEGAGVSAIALAPDGHPVVAFTDIAGQISVARCSDAACTEPSIVTVREGADWTQYVSIAVPPDDRPIVAFVADDTAEIRLARCTDPSCAKATEVVVGSNAERWWVNSLDLRVGSDGFPVLVVALASGEAQLAHCADTDCTKVTTSQLATKGNDKITAALGIGADGAPVVALYSDGSLVFTRCADPACATVTTTRLDDATAGWWTPIGVGFDPVGLPVIAYYSPTNRDTKIALCKDPGCAAADLVPVADSDANGADDQTGIAFLPDGSPIFVYAREPGLYVEACASPRCGS
jgi:hypothetical protein